MEGEMKGISVRRMTGRVLEEEERKRRTEGRYNGGKDTMDEKCEEE